jgi:hypothetical protein
MKRKEHLPLYTAEAAVLSEVMNSQRPEVQEKYGAPETVSLAYKLTVRKCKPSFDHIWEVQVFVFLLSLGTEPLFPGLILGLGETYYINLTKCQILV